MPSVQVWPPLIFPLPKPYAHSTRSAKLGQLLVWEWQSETYVLKQQGHFHDMNSIAYAPDASIIGAQNALHTSYASRPI